MSRFTYASKTLMSISDHPNFLKIASAKCLLVVIHKSLFKMLFSNYRD